MYKTIHAHRRHATNQAHLKKLLQGLEALLFDFLNLLHRQDLVMQYRGLTYEDKKRVKICSGHGH